MNRLLLLLACLTVSGCVLKRPNPTLAAFYYPNESLAELPTVSFLRHEYTDIGLDGGSHVYILSTPDKKKVALWNRCLAVKEEYGYDPAKNAFMLKTGDRREDEHIVEPQSALEKLLIEKIGSANAKKAKFPEQPLREAEIVRGLRDRSHAIAF